VPMLGSDGFAPVYGEALPAAALGLYFVAAGVPVSGLDARRRALAGELSRRLRAPVKPWPLAGVAAAEVLLDAIARSDGTRASVTAALREVDVETVFGRIRFDAGGDVVGPRFTVMRWDGRSDGHDRGSRGLAVDRVIVPRGL
jgi:ABC-type branched-subunit amino acid transport system substrate-binding protein